VTTTEKRAQDLERKKVRAGGLDVLRGLAVVLLLVDHLWAMLWGVYGWGWAVDVRFLTRPSLPFFMVVSGTLLAQHTDTLAAVKRQAWRVLPWAMAATVLASVVTRFNQPEPLTVYLAALPVVLLLRRWPVVGMAGCLLATLYLAPYWPLPSYDPLEQAAWLLLGVVLWDWRGVWWSRWSSVPGASLLAAVGRRSMWWYVGELAALAAFCIAVGAPGGFV
jgi:hypothetical protein